MKKFWKNVLAVCLTIFYGREAFCDKNQHNFFFTKNEALNHLLFLSFLKNGCNV